MKAHLLACCVVLLVACSAPVPSTPSSPTEPPTAVPTEFIIIFRCNSCAEEGIEINLWDSPEQNKVTGSSPHGSTAVVRDQQLYDGHLYYYVRASNGNVGWVARTFVTR